MLTSNILGTDLSLINTLITFSCNKGKFVDEGGNNLGMSIVSKTLNGRAYARYNAGAVATTTPGIEPVYVTVSIGDISSTREVMIYPGNPFKHPFTIFCPSGRSDDRNRYQFGRQSKTIFICLLLSMIPWGTLSYKTCPL